MRIIKMSDEPSLPPQRQIPEFFRSSGSHFSASSDVWKQNLTELKAMPEFAEEAKFWQQAYSMLTVHLHHIIKINPPAPAPPVVGLEPSIRDALSAGRKEVQAMMKNAGIQDPKAG
jgi:hypothetical protein